jgi:hypothetical protein
VEAPVTLRQRLHDMEETPASMHGLLRQMRVKAAPSSTDPLVKANLGCVGADVGHLERQLQELRVATAAREDMETCPAAMYKRVEAKADEAARAAGAAQALPSAPAGRSAVQSAAGQTAGRIRLAPCRRRLPALRRRQPPLLCLTKRRFEE